MNEQYALSTVKFFAYQECFYSGFVRFRACDLQGCVAMVILEVGQLLVSTKKYRDVVAMTTESGSM